MPRHHGTRHANAEYLYMIPALRTTGLHGSANATSRTVTKPTAVQNGDLLVVNLALRGNADAITAPSGWTVMQETQFNAGGGHFLTYYKIASNEGANWVWSWTNLADNNASIAAFSGIDPVRPFISSTTNPNIASSVNSTALTLTPDTRRALVVTAHANQNSRTYTPPTGMLEATDVGSGPSSSLHYFFEPKPPSAVGNQIATLSTADVNGAQMLAFRPRRIGIPS
jgi:hypothetical protein